MIYEILCNGQVHYTRPHDHPDVQEALDLIAQQRRAYGVTSYEVRPTQGTLDSGYCNCQYQTVARALACPNCVVCGKPPLSVT